MATPLKLIQDWNGFRRGTLLPIVPEGQAKVMIGRGIARLANEVESKDKTNAKLCEDLPIEVAEEKPKKKATKKAVKKNVSSKKVDNTE